MTTKSPDGSITTVQDTYIGDVNAKLTGKEGFHPRFEFAKDDEGAEHQL